jgi:hypothetical protein
MRPAPDSTRVQELERRCPWLRDHVRGFRCSCERSDLSADRPDDSSFMRSERIKLRVLLDKFLSLCLDLSNSAEPLPVLRFLVSRELTSNMFESQCASYIRVEWSLGFDEAPRVVLQAVCRAAHSQKPAQCRASSRS